MKNWQRIASLILLAGMQSACWNAAYTGASMIYDRNQLMDSWKNQAISFQANHQFRQEVRYYPNCRISVASFNYDVLMVGQMSTQALKDQAEKSVRQIPGIKRLFNRLEVRRPLSAWEQSVDAWITTKIRSRILAHPRLNPREVKIITEDRVVYILGTVKPEHGKIIIDFARQTEGVKRVIPILRYIYIQNYSANDQDSAVMG